MFRIPLFVVLLTLLGPLVCKGQTNVIKANIRLIDSLHRFQIQQKITFYNTSDTLLTQLYLHNWGNSFKDDNTPLAKRFIEDYQKEFHFSTSKDRGYSNIKNLAVNYQQVPFSTVKDQEDIVKITLNRPLFPKDSVQITMLYELRVPNARFTGYGKTKSGYHLRFWNIVPAVYKNGWQLMSNLNLDDLYQDVANYDIHLQLPKKYQLQSNLFQYESIAKTYRAYHLVGYRKKDIILHINPKKSFKSFLTNTQEIKTDAYSSKISNETTTQIIRKQIDFIERYLGKHPHTEIFVDRSTTRKNSLHELYGLPSWLKPFPKNFRWDVNFFKALCSKYIDDVVLHNKRKEYWFVDALETFLMMEYLKTYYPDITILGKYSNYWPLKHYNISKLKQRDRFAFMYQFSARKFYDQALNVPADSLSNFNRKIVSKYKSGLGFKYLQDYLGKDNFQKILRSYLFSANLNLDSPQAFLDSLEAKSPKDISWYRTDYLQTDKKIDYKISAIKKVPHLDSLDVTIKNKRDFAAPVALYGIDKKKITFKQWIPKIQHTQTVRIPKGNYTKLALNYENSYPEYNSLDNYRTTGNKLLNKPLQFRFLKDIEDPYYNQLFYYPDIKYNLYDGVILGMKINNQPIIPHNFSFTLTPNYSTRSKNFTGAFSLGYDHFFQGTSIYKIRYGIQGSNFHYAPELGYNTFVPYVSIAFRRKTLRDVGFKSFTTRLFYIRKEVAPGAPVTEEDRYKVLNFRYIYSKPDIIRRLQYAVNLELGNNFTKLSTDIRYRKFFTNEKRFDIRVFGGMFITNNSKGDYFSFGLNRSSDYLFEQNLFGRSENSGLFSQQFVISDAGFKSKYSSPQRANQFALAVNTSVSVWRWVELYNDVAMLKNKKSDPKFYYENGIRLNFVPNIFEFYFPIYTNEGWEFNQGSYPSKIRFVFTTNLDRIYNFIRRGIL
ncbi:Aminopeptidase [Tenacibaculum litopenaei]|uniref:aminopeptidase n=1 Tax=Tenacibaculum litopenaei TaxID=396016 RepID=UPI00389566A3